MTKANADDEADPETYVYDLLPDNNLYEGEYGMDLHTGPCVGTTSGLDCYSTLEHESGTTPPAFDDLHALSLQLEASEANGMPRRKRALDSDATPSGGVRAYRNKVALTALSAVCGFAHGSLFRRGGRYIAAQLKGSPSP